MRGRPASSVMLASHALEDPGLHSEAGEPAGRPLLIFPPRLKCGCSRWAIIVTPTETRQGSKQAEPEPDSRLTCTEYDIQAPREGLLSGCAPLQGRTPSPARSHEGRLRALRELAAVVASYLTSASVKHRELPSCRPSDPAAPAEDSDYDPFSSSFNRKRPGIGLVEKTRTRLFAFWSRARAHDSSARRLRLKVMRPRRSRRRESSSSSSAGNVTDDISVVHRVRLRRRAAGTQGRPRTVSRPRDTPRSWARCSAHSILEMDEPEHHTYRGLVAAGVQPQGQMEIWEARSRAGGGSSTRMLDEIIDAKRGDLVRKLDSSRSRCS